MPITYYEYLDHALRDILERRTATRRVNDLFLTAQVAIKSDGHDFGKFITELRDLIRSHYPELTLVRLGTSEGQYLLVLNERYIDRSGLPAEPPTPPNFYLLGAVLLLMFFITTLLRDLT